MSIANRFFISDKRRIGPAAFRPGRIVQMPCCLVLALLIGNALPPAIQAASESSTYACQPALPVFCRNIHVGCAGKTNIPTQPFRVSIAGNDARIEFATPQSVASGSVTLGDDLVVRLIDSPDWIRIEANGRYSHRTYRNGDAAISNGVCKVLRP